MSVVSQRSLDSACGLRRRSLPGFLLRQGARTCDSPSERLSLPGSDDTWTLPLPPPAPWKAAATELRWLATFAGPWIYRRARGRSSGDGRTAKRPQLTPVIHPTSAGKHPLTLKTDAARHHHGEPLAAARPARCRLRSCTRRTAITPNLATTGGPRSHRCRPVQQRLLRALRSGLSTHAESRTCLTEGNQCPCFANGR
jgi:hypothetical protein